MADAPVESQGGDEIEIKKLDLTDGDVVLLRIPDDMVPFYEQVGAAFGEMLKAQGFPNCVVVVMRPGSDVAALDENEMRRYGWVRAESISGVVAPK